MKIQTIILILLTFLSTIVGAQVTPLESGGLVDARRNSPWIGGETTLGTKNYPNHGFMARGSLGFDSESGIECSLVDSKSRTAYFAGRGYDQPFIVRVDLETGRPISTLTLEEEDGRICCAVADAEMRYGYFGTQAQPGRVIKVDLKDFKRVDTLVTEDGEDNLFSAVLDPLRNIAYFGTVTFPGKIIKVDLNTFQRTDAMTAPEGIGHFFSGVFDPRRNEAIWGSDVFPASIIKVDLHTMTMTDQIMLGPNEYSPTVAVINPTEDVLYYAFGSPGRLMQIDLRTFTRTGTIETGTGFLHGVAFDPVEQKAYFGCLARFPGLIVRVDLRNHHTDGVLLLNEDESEVNTLVIDDVTRTGIAPASYYPAALVKFDLGTFTRQSAVPLALSEGEFNCGFADPLRDVVYFGGAHSYIVKVNVHSMTREPTTRATDTGEYLWSATADIPGRYGYFGTRNTPGRVIRFNLETSLPDGQLILENGENELMSAGISLSRREAYFGTATAPGRLVRVDLDTFARVDSITLQPGEDIVRSMAIDDEGGIAYLGLNTDPGRVIKVDLNSFTRVDSIILESGESYLRSAIMDPGKAAYFGTYQNPAEVIKIDAASFSRAGALTLGTDLRSAVIDPQRRFAAFGSFSQPARVTILDLDQFAILGGASFGVATNDFRSAAFDPESGAMFFASLSDPGRVAKMIVNHQGGLRGLRMSFGLDSIIADMHFHSFKAEGNLLFSIYTDEKPRKLIWESNLVENTANNAEIVVPISSGSPARLRLPAGKYWLAWQTDSSGQIGAYRPGLASEGFLFDQPFEPPPVQLNEGFVSMTGQRWTQYVSYDHDPLVPMILGKDPSNDIADRNQDGLLDMSDVYR